MPAANLIVAAQDTYNNLYPLWLANTLASSLTNFWQAMLPAFPDQDANGRPVANWLTLIASLANQMPATAVPYSQLDVASNFVYRLCYVANYLETAGLISTAQATALLAAYNTYL